MTTPYQDAVLALGPVAFWPLDDAPGSTTAHDLTGNGHTGAQAGGGAGPPVFGNPAGPGGTTALSVPPSRYFTAPGAAFPRAGPQTYVGWFSLVDNGQQQVLLGASPSDPNGYLISNASDGRIQWVASTFITEPAIDRLDAGPFMVAITISDLLDGTGNAHLYVNGVLVKAGTTPITHPNAAVTPRIFGTPTADKSPAGIAYNVATFDRVLTAGEIADLYEVAVPPTPLTDYQTAVLADEPVAFWPLDDGNQVSKLRDLTGNAHRATVVSPSTALYGQEAPPGDSGWASMDLDFSASYITGPSAVAATLAGGPFTYEGWYNLDPTGTTQVLTGMVGGTQGYVQVQASTNTLRWVGVNPSFLQEWYGGRIGVGWMHIVATQEDDGHLVLYVNGEPVLDGFAAVADNGSMRVLGSSSGTTPKGPVANIAVYDRVLTPAEVLAHYRVAVPEGALPSFPAIAIPPRSEAADLTRTLDTPRDPADASRTLQLIGDAHFGIIAGGRPKLLQVDLNSERFPCPVPAARIFMGDITNAALTVQQAQYLAFKASLLDAPIYEVLGAHDVYQDVVTPDQAAATYGMPSPNYTVDLGFAELVVIYLGTTYGSGYVLSAGTAAWLDATLAAATKDVILACHYPLHDTVGGDPALQFVSTAAGFYARGSVVTTDSSDVLAVLAAHPGKVRAWLSAHTHSNINTPGIFTTLDVGGEPMVHVNCSATVSQDRAYSPYAPVETLFATYHGTETDDPHLDLRWRASQLRGWTAALDTDRAQRIETV